MIREAAPPRSPEREERRPPLTCRVPSGLKSPPTRHISTVLPNCSAIAKTQPLRQTLSAKRAAEYSDWEGNVAQQ
jgi:hypothetical protein